MKFYKYLYIGEKVHKAAKIKRKLKQHAGVEVYVILLANGADQLEIMNSIFLKQKYYRYHPPIVIGLASDYDEAVNIVVDITKECLEMTGNCNLKEYLKQKAYGGSK